MRLATKSRSHCRATATTSSAWAAVRASGFSTMTLPGHESGHRLREVAERWGGDVNHVHVVAPEEFTDLVDVRDREPGRGGPRRGPVGPGHADKRNAGHLNELLECEQPESAAANHTKSNEAVVHGYQSCGWKYERRIALKKFGTPLNIEHYAIIPARRRNPFWRPSARGRRCSVSQA